ncbi:helix-turn-helix domain-containing protein [Plantactinospora sp. S1510]|uniref:Helix-turn-helix domain-containing protein n=1 Tax=Plantactinospora alkalitolerans TaxID=2789879 RepID=A0ABS0HAN3_9ACTN|nr:helix-turn-helix domain-containing protein [Plantactinospora alkalitolerans]MBF9135361.1 helix-turn-helix domain-containing protein [Plantactinospora alkalitolerans]
MTERPELQDAVVARCKARALLCYHTYDSRRSQKGFFDIVAMGPGGIVLWELKREGEKPTKAQQEWLDAAGRLGLTVAVIRPSDLFSGYVDREIARLAAPQRRRTVTERLRALQAVLRTAREAHGWTQDEFAKRVGTSQSHLSDIERGVTFPQVDTLLRIAEELGIHDLAI